MEVYFVENLCLDNISGMNEEMNIQEMMGAEILLVNDLWEVPDGAFYFDGYTICRNI